MPNDKPFSQAEKPRPEALARWENEGGADPCSPQVPGVAKIAGRRNRRLREAKSELDIVPPESKSSASKPTKPVLLSGGNPQIAKGYGDEPVQAYIAAMPDWKRDVGRRIDALIERTVPGVSKGVKWNSPFYGMESPPDSPKTWFLAFHCFTKYIKVTFFRGLSLNPVPPVASRSGDTRYFHIHEDDQLDEAQFAGWVKQASLLPGEKM